MTKLHSIPLHENEAQLKVYRETELVLIKPAILILALIFIPWFFLIQYGLDVQFRRILFVWTLGVSLYAAKVYFLWHLKQYIITNKRLIHVSHYGLFKKRVVETPLERVLNVSFRTTGILSSVFSFGDVEVQVVGLLEPITLNNISNPGKIKDYLWELHGKQDASQKLFDKQSIPTLEQQIGYEKMKK